MSEVLYGCNSVEERVLGKVTLAGCRWCLRGGFVTDLSASRESEE